MTELTQVSSIEEKLTGIVSKGLTVWDRLKTDKMKRRFEVEKSFMRS